jgi:hypothetical protein
VANEVHGSKAQLKLAAAIVAGGNNLSVSESFDTAEVTAFADAAKRYIAGLADGTFQFDASWQPANITALIALKAIVTTFELAPAGPATGNEKLTGSCIMTSLQRTSSTGDKVGISAQFQITGGVTQGTY